MEEKPTHLRHELVRRQRREALAALDAGELYHLMSPEAYRGLLLDSLFEYELDLLELERETWPAD